MAITATYAQEETYTNYFTADDLPNGVVWLPAPPDTTSTEFVYDITQYMRQQHIGLLALRRWLDSSVYPSE